MAVADRGAPGSASEGSSTPSRCTRRRTALTRRWPGLGLASSTASAIAACAGVRRYSSSVEAEPQGRGHGRLELPRDVAGGDPRQRPLALHGPEGELLGQRPVARLEVARLALQRPVGVGALLEHPPDDRVRGDAARGSRRSSSPSSSAGAGRAGAGGTPAQPGGRRHRAPPGAGPRSARVPVERAVAVGGQDARGPPAPGASARAAWTPSIPSSPRSTRAPMCGCSARTTRS